jgi:hypothetical protein
MYKPGNRKSYALLFKLKVAKEVIEQNKKIQTTAFKYNISNKSVRDWVGKIVEIKEQLKKRNNRLSFRMRRRSLMTALETGLFNWIKDARSNGACLSSKVIKLKAIELVNEIGTTSDFKASNGWFERFLARSGLCCRRVSSSGRDLPQNSQETIDLFIQNCKKFNQLGNRVIYNMDEASIYLDSPGYFYFN